MKKTQLATKEEYYQKRVMLSWEDTIREAVRREELMNSTYQPITIPKLRYPKSDLKGFDLWKIIHSFLP